MFLHLLAVHWVLAGLLTLLVIFCALAWIVGGAIEDEFFGPPA